MREVEENPAEVSEAECSSVTSEDALQEASGGTYAPDGLVLDRSGTPGTAGDGSGYRAIA